MLDSMKHTGGSISFGKHKKKMEVQLKCPVSFRELYDRVHKKKTGEYVSERAKNIVESYDNAMADKYGEDSSTYPMVDEEVWLDVAGPSKKGGIPGTGQALDLVSAQDSTRVSSSFEGSSNAPSFTEAHFTRVENATLSSFVQTQPVPLLSRIPGFEAKGIQFDKASSQQRQAPEEEDEENVDEDLNLD